MSGGAEPALDESPATTLHRMVEHESEITPADHAGGTSTSHTIMIDSLAALLE
ncbi:MAG: hypothetical protein ACI841_005197, partial [Planctomycetota bacterium]